MPEATRSKLFISYSHEDERWRKRVVAHLGVLEEEGLIDLWDDRKLEAGADWYRNIDEQMRRARIAMLLVSPPFLTSRFIRDEEVPRLFDRHGQAGMTIYPLLVRPCAWQVVKWLAALQLRPAGAKPLASLRGAKAEEVLAAIALEIASIAKGQSELPGRTRHSEQRGAALEAAGSAQPRRSRAGTSAQREARKRGGVPPSARESTSTSPTKPDHPPSIDTAGGAYVRGNVNVARGKFVGRDDVSMTIVGKGATREDFSRLLEEFAGIVAGARLPDKTESLPTWYESERGCVFPTRYESEA